MHYQLLFRQRRMRWLGHVLRMKYGRISKGILYGELFAGKRNLERSHLRYRDVCKRDMEKMNIDLDKWEGLTMGQVEKLFLSHFKS